MEEIRTKGFVRYPEIDHCVDCKYSSENSSSTRLECNKLERSFEVSFESTCDEFEEDTEI